MNWLVLQFGYISRSEIKTYTSDPKWQKVRESMIAQSLEQKHETLLQWLEQNNYSRASRVQVTNYVNSLRRGGLI